MIKIKSETGDEVLLNKQFLLDADSNKYIENNIYNRIIPNRIILYIKEFHELNSSTNVSHTYYKLEKPLKYTEFIKNFKNICYYEFINKLSITEINYLFDVAETLKYSNLEEMCAAKLADYFKKITPREMKEKFLLFKNNLTDDDLRYLIEADPDFKELHSRIEENIKTNEINNNENKKDIHFENNFGNVNNSDYNKKSIDNNLKNLNEPSNISNVSKNNNITKVDEETIEKIITMSSEIKNNSYFTYISDIHVPLKRIN